MPGREEQDTICSVLVDVDTELGVLRSRLEKTESIKQAMVQDLLSGRTRLPVASAAT